MCGIFGYVGSQDAQPILLEGLKRLEYRGYEGAGMATIHDGKLHIRKVTGKVAELEALLEKEPLPGTIGIAPSANINPEREFPSLFEPVHGSAPDIYGRGIANPIGQIWSGAMMLEHLGHPDAAKAIIDAIETILVEGPRTPDIGGKAGTADLGKAVADAI